MLTLLPILTRVILPIFMMIGIGFALDRALRVDVQTLARLNFYVFVPAMAFHALRTTPLTTSAMGAVALFSAVVMLALLALGWALFWRRDDVRPVLACGTGFYNAGNFGFPFVALAFSEAMVSVMAMQLVIQNILVFTIGVLVFQSVAPKGNGDSALKALLKVPVVHAVWAGLLARWLQNSLEWELPTLITRPSEYVANGMISVALLTLGVQLSRNRGSVEAKPLVGFAFLKLLIGPLLAWGLTLAFDFDPITNAVLIVAAGLPMGVNVFILASEYRYGQELASQAVFWTTLLSAVTLPFWLLVVR